LTKQSGKYKIIVAKKCDEIQTLAKTKTPEVCETSGVFYSVM
jgi:hypothetical protein